MLKTKNASRRKRRHWHVRKKVSGTSAIPRLNVYKSSKHMYAQLIDDVAGVTLVSASTVQKDAQGGKSTTVEGAAVVGKLVAEKALKAGITKVVFDRGGFKFHGRVKSLADAARETGLQF
jgi:large subunit ribosomal protein L18